VWLPGQQKFREISSCSDFGTFQSRRAGIRTKSKDGARGFAATLNGSGLPIGRTLVAILEQGQQADGTVRIPDALVHYAGFDTLKPE
jgi:seryl-tRNA synthetase